MNEISPAVLVFAGPNGSGKSTVTKGFNIIGEYINADEIKKKEKCTDLEAAVIATSLRENAIRNRMDFTFETVLSTPRNVELLRNAKKVGYWIEVVLVLTADAEINVSRVKDRVRKGGHDVPAEKVRSRYKRSLANLSELLKFCDVVNVVDNSTDKAELIISMKDRKIVIHKCKNWDEEKLQRLLEGNL